LKAPTLDESNPDLSDVTSGEEEPDELEVIPESPKSEDVDKDGTFFGKSGKKKLEQKEESLDKKTLASIDSLEVDDQFTEKSKESATTSESQKDQFNALSSSESKHGKLSKMYAFDESTKFSRLRDDRSDDTETSESRELEITIDANPAHPISIIEKFANDGKSQVKQGIMNALKTYSNDQVTIEKTNKQKEAVSSTLLLQEQTMLPSKPLLERLLPIGPTNKSKNVHSVGGDKKTTQTQDLIATLGLVSNEIPLPPTERLLPIGPIKPYKSPFPPGVRRFISPPRMKQMLDETDELSGLCKFKYHSMEKLKQDESKDEKKEEKSEQLDLQKEQECKKVSAKQYQINLNQYKSESKLKSNSQSSKTEVVEAISNIDEPKPSKSGSNFLETKLTNKLAQLKSRKQFSQESSDDELRKEKQSISRKDNGDQSRELMKQNVKIDTNEEDSMTADTNPVELQTDDQKNPKPLFKQKRKRKSGLNTNEYGQKETRNSAQSSGRGSLGVQRRARKADSSLYDGPSKRSSTSQSSLAYVEENTYEKCSNCGNVLEDFSEEEIGMCIVILGTYIHREPEMAAPILPEILKLVAKFAIFVPYPWQCERLVHLAYNPFIFF